MIGLEFYEIPAELKEKYGDFYADPINNDLVDNYRIQVNHTINNPAVFQIPAAINYKQRRYRLYTIMFGAGYFKYRQYSIE